MSSPARREWTAKPARPCPRPGPSNRRCLPVHRREESRFQLWLNGDALTALRLARENWNVQREPAVLRVHAEAAAATGDPGAKEIVRQWLAQTGLEYPEVAVMVDAGRGGRK